LKKDRDAELERCNQLQNRYDKAIIARGIIQKAAQETQKHVEIYIGGIGTAALKAIFPDPYNFIVKFELRRGRTECDLLFEKNGKEMHPLESSGYGACNIASFTSHLSLWRLKKTRPVMIMDEPLPNLSLNYQEAASYMIKTLSDRLGIQVIMASHNPDIIANADNIIEIG